MNQIKYNLGGENLMKKTKAFLIVFSPPKLYFI